MNKEEAIKQLKKHKQEIDEQYISSRYSKAIEVALNLIQKQEKEIELLSKKLYLCTPEIPQNEHQEYVAYVDLINKIIKLEKIIDKMAEEILKIDTAKSKFEYDHAKVWDTEKGIKEYFKKVVDEDVKDKR